MLLRNQKVVGQTSEGSENMAELKKNTENVIEKRRATGNGEQQEMGVPPHVVENEDLREELARANRRSEEYKEEFLKFKRRSELLTEQLNLMEGLNYQARQTHTPSTWYEDGRNMAESLFLYELQCAEDNIPQEQWGLKIFRHLKGDALAFYLRMRRRSAIDFHQWEAVRERLLRQFCRDSRRSVLAQLGRNNWRGDHTLYSRRFSQAASRAESFPAEELVDLFLSKLPFELQRQLTKNFTSYFEDWEDASDALADLMEPYCAKQAAFRRCLRDMDEAVKEQARLNPGNNARSLDAKAPRCKECQGVGHRDVNCPLLQPRFVPKRGRTCLRCGGKDHFAADCASKAIKPTATMPSAAACVEVEERTSVPSNDEA